MADETLRAGYLGCSDGEDAAAAERRAHRHRVAEQPAEALHDRQAEAQALRARALELVVLVEDPLLLLRSGCRCPSRRSRGAAARRRERAAADDDAAALGVADGVGDAGSSACARAAPDRCARTPRCAPRAAPASSARRSALSASTTLLDQRHQRERDHVGLDHARLDLRDVEHAVEQLLEGLHRELHAVHHAQRVGVGRRAPRAPRRTSTAPASAADDEADLRLIDLGRIDGLRRREARGRRRACASARRRGGRRSARRRCAACSAGTASRSARAPTAPARAA